MTLDSLPVGTVLHSMLTEIQFQSLIGKGWVISDGRSVVGSAYAKLTGNTNIPDMRGRFLRAKNNGSTTNPDGELALGTSSADKYASHGHTFYSGTGTSGSYPYTSGSTASPTSWGAAVGANGGNETAPKSTTVNIFIKIN